MSSPWKVHFEIPHSGGAEDSGRLACEIMSWGEWFQTFRRVLGACVFTG